MTIDWCYLIIPNSAYATAGKGTCATADCGGVLQCNGAGGTPPASLAEFTLDSPMDFYDVSFVDGFNIPISVYPSCGTGNCSNIQCSSDINLQCPQELQLKTYDGTTVACKSACFAFNKPEYCCTGEFNNPTTCKPTEYSQYFKSSCKDAYSYAYDDATSIFTCKGANYLISFCWFEIYKWQVWWLLCLGFYCTSLWIQEIPYWIGQYVWMNIDTYMKIMWVHKWNKKIIILVTFEGMKDNTCFQ